jgi:hypothetical protein
MTLPAVRLRQLSPLKSEKCLIYFLLDRINRIYWILFAIKLKFIE